MKKILTKDYLRQHPVEEMSAACIQYTLLQYEDIDRIFDEKILPQAMEAGVDLPDPETDKKLVSSQEDVEGLLRLMRRGLTPGAKSMLRRKLLEQQEIVMPMIQKRILGSFVDHFVENAVFLFVRCEENYSEWLLEHYHEIRNPYAQCMMCLVLGFRADVTVVPFLKAQVDRFETAFPDETYSQAPLLALCELQGRFCD